MSIVVIVLACVLAAAGAAAAEWIRLRRGWLVGIGPSYSTAASIAVSVVLAQVIWTSLGLSDAGIAPVGSLACDLLMAVVVGPVLHGIIWLLILQGWEAIRAALAAAAKPGRRPPRP